MNSCAHCAVRETAICQSLSASELDTFNRMGRHQVHQRGQTMVWQGEDPLLVGNVIEGVLKLSSASRDGREQTLGILFPGDFIGRPFGSRSHHSVVALTDVKVCTFRRTAFEDFARDHADLEHRLLQRTLEELDHTRRWMVLLGRKSASERVAAFLLEMSSRCANADGDGRTGQARLDLPLSRQDIADLLGLTIETVSRRITCLREEGIIATPNRRAVVILDAKRLELCAEAA